MLTPNEADTLKHFNSGKRLLFKKPTWAKTIPNGQNEDQDQLFHRSNRAYDHTSKKDKITVNAIEDDHAGRQTNSAVSSLESSETPVGVCVDDVVECKSLNPDDEVEPESIEPIIKEVTADGNLPLDALRPAITASLSSPALPLEHTNASEQPRGPARQDSSADPAGNLDHFDYTDGLVASKSTPEDKVQPNRSSDSKKCHDKDTSADDEFPELARKAREEARRKRSHYDRSGPEQDNVSLGHRKSQLCHLEESHGSPMSADVDHTLSILVTSKINNTEPLIVTRRLSQRLKDVRIAWVKHQALHADILNRCFLTWRGRRLFDVTSCKGMGLFVDEDGALRSVGDEEVCQHGRIHVEAMTPEMFEAHKKAKDDSAFGLAKEDEDDTRHLARPATSTEAQIRIVLKAKSFSEFRLMVKPSTTISKILNAFRARNQIMPEKDVLLYFDGEQLKAESSIEDTEITDLDHIEAYVR